LKRELEALLFATDSPLTAARLKKIFPEASTADIKATVAELDKEYNDAGQAFTVVEFGGGWQIATRPEYSPLIEKLLKTRKYSRLSRAGLEVLAIVAYRQPITRLEIDDIRGVQSSGALATLQERNLITVVGRSEAVGHPLLYGTTRDFLGHLGLKGLSQLPDLPTIEEVVENRDDLRTFASQFGEELTDEDLERLKAAQAEVSDDVAAEEEVVEVEEAADEVVVDQPEISEPEVDAPVDESQDPQIEEEATDSEDHETDKQA